MFRARLSADGGQTTRAPHPLAPELASQTLETSQQRRGSAPIGVDWDGKAAVDEPGPHPDLGVISEV